MRSWNFAGEFLLPTVIPAAVAFLLGLLVRGFVSEQALHGDVLVAVATLVAAWLIQRALVFRSELERIPIEGIASATTRMTDVANECLKTSPDASITDPILLYNLRLMSNEIDWLRTVVERVGSPTREMERLADTYISFKNALTGGDVVDLSAAARCAVLLRSRCLDLRWKISKRILAFASERHNTPFG